MFYIGEDPKGFPEGFSGMGAQDVFPGGADALALEDGLLFVVVMHDLAFDGGFPVIAIISEAFREAVAIVVVISGASIVIHFEEQAQPAAPAPFLIPGMVEPELEFMLGEFKGGVGNEFEIEGHFLAYVVGAVIESVAQDRFGTVSVLFRIEELRAELPIIIERLVEVLALGG